MQSEADIIDKQRAEWQKQFAEDTAQPFEIIVLSFQTIFRFVYLTLRGELIIMSITADNQVLIVEDGTGHRWSSSTNAVQCPEYCLAEWISASQQGTVDLVVIFGLLTYIGKKKMQ